MIANEKNIYMKKAMIITWKENLYPRTEYNVVYFIVN